MLPQTFQLSLNDIFYILMIGFILGVAAATLLYLHLSNTIRIRPPTRTFSYRDCDERYE